MKTKKKRIETISETTMFLILKNSANSARQGWCEQCSAEVYWIDAAAIGSPGSSGLRKNDAIHTKGSFVCSGSLIEEIKKGEKL